MAKQSVRFWLAAALVLNLLGCGPQDKYADVKDSLTKLNQSFKQFTDQMTNAKVSGDVAKALNDFADQFAPAQKALQQAQSKHPELKKNKLPKDIQDLVDTTSSYSVKMLDAIQLAMAFNDDQAVKDARQRLYKIFSLAE